MQLVASGFQAVSLPEGLTMDARQALQTRERAAATAWAVYQRNVMGLSLLAICELAKVAPMRLDDGAYSFQGGLGRGLAKSTLHFWLSEARDQFRDEYIKRPILDMIMEEDDRLEHLAAMHMQDARRFENNIIARGNSLDRYLRTIESRRKLLGIDRPQQIEVINADDRHDDPATVKLNAAMQAAQERRDRLKAEVAAKK